MSVTKRKFSALLQSLNEPHATIHESKEARESTSGKRRRLGLPSSTTSKFGTAASRVAHATSSITTSARSHDKSDSTAQTSLIKYCPTSRPELLRRLETFQDITRWAAKPDKINELEWARKGWVCRAKETVRCILCNREVVVKLNLPATRISDPTEIEADGAEEALSTLAALVDKYADLMTTSHQSDCLWRVRDCNASLLRLPLANGRTTAADLRQRYHELIARREHLPDIANVRLPEKLDIDAVLSVLPPNFPDNPAPDLSPIRNDLDRVALALATTGWQGLPDARIGTVKNTVSCRTCFRRLGLWMFRKHEGIDTGKSDGPPAPVDHLDPIEEHRSFCPWRNPNSQNSPGLVANNSADMAGWQALLRTLENESRLVHKGDGNVAERGQQPATPEKSASLDGLPPDEETLDTLDQERWARLKKLKSLFDVKGVRNRTRKK